MASSSAAVEDGTIIVGGIFLSASDLCVVMTVTFSVFPLDTVAFLRRSLWPKMMVCVASDVGGGVTSLLSDLMTTIVLAPCGCGMISNLTPVPLTFGTSFAGGVECGDRLWMTVLVPGGVGVFLLHGGVEVFLFTAG